MNYTMMSRLAVLVLFSGVGLFFWNKASVVDEQANLEVKRLLENIEKHHIALKQEVLRIRTYDNRNYDRPVQLNQQIDQALVELQWLVNAVLLTKDANTQAEIQRYIEARKDVAAALQKFISTNAILNNSERYLVFLVQELTDELQANHQQNISYQYLTVSEDILVNIHKLNKGSTALTVKNLQQDVASLEAIFSEYDIDEGSNFRSLIDHITIVYQQFPVYEKAMEKVLGFSYQDYIQGIESEYAVSWSAAKANKNYSLLMFYVSITLLLCYIAFTIYHFVISSRHQQSRLQFEVDENVEELKQTNQLLIQEVKQRKLAEEELKDAAAVYENSLDGIILCHADTEIFAVNDAYLKITGYSRQEVIGAKPTMFKSDAHDEKFYRQMWKSIETKGGWEGEITNKDRSGLLHYRHLSVISLTDEAGDVYRYIGIYRDITEQKENEEFIWYQANYDSLTGLPNRNLFNHKITQLIESYQTSDEQFALMFIDLDNFKMVNDNLGHATGDELLIDVAHRLKNCLRASDLVARLSGDEFVVVLPSCNNSADVERIAEQILSALVSPIIINSHELFVSASIGVTLYPSDGLTTMQLLKNADIAMYYAKEQGKNTYRFYQEEMNTRLIRYTELEKNLRFAIANNEFSLMYQPVTNSATGEIGGVEALLRWNNDLLGRVSPDEFIPVAEDTGFIVALGEWVVAQACRDYRTLLDQGHHIGVLKINVSVRQLREENFNQRLVELLDEQKVPLSAICLEITERLFLEDTQGVILSKLTALQSKGVRIALDDFGTGYSSLSYLQRFPVDILKIDKVFITHAESQDNSDKLMRAIVDMARSFDLLVVAEGVENPTQLALVKQLGCDYVQGNYLCEPLLLDDLLKHLVKLSEGEK